MAPEHSKLGRYFRRKRSHPGQPKTVALELPSCIRNQIEAERRLMLLNPALAEQIL